MYGTRKGTWKTRLLRTTPLGYALNTLVGGNAPPRHATCSFHGRIRRNFSAKFLPRIIRWLPVFAILLEFQVGQVEIAVGLLFVNLRLFLSGTCGVHLVYPAHDEIVIVS